jgi:hypothetical protein
MGEDEITRFLSALAVRGQVSASTQNQALWALLLLYRHVLGQNVGWLEDVVRAKRPHRLQVVLTGPESKRCSVLWMGSTGSWPACYTVRACSCWSVCVSE